MRKTSLFITVSIFFMLVMPLAAKAFEVKTNNAVFIPQGETIEGNLYAAGTTITIDGEVTGDVICGGQSININGPVGGDVICGGQSININGPVGGNIRIGGNTITLNSSTTRNVMTFGSSIVLSPSAEIKGDMLIAGATADIRGKVNGNLHGAGANVIIDGEIGKDVKLKLGDTSSQTQTGFGYQGQKPLTITDNALINGSVFYKSFTTGEISDKANIAGEIKHTLPPEKESQNFTALRRWYNLFSVFSALIIGLVIVSLWRKKIIEITDDMLKKTSSSFAWGVAITFLTPIIAAVLVFTLIGIPLAMIVFAFWLTALYVGKIITGILVGRSLVEKFSKSKKESLIWSMIIGVIIIWIISSIPILGWILSLLAVWWGIGGLWLHFRKA